MREGWRLVQLGDLIKKRTDFTTVRPEDKYVILGVQRSGWGFVERAPILGSSMKFTKLLQVELDDLVYRTITAFEAPSAVVGPNEVGHFVTPQTFPVFKIDGSELLPGYMSLLTSWPMFHDAMASRCTGTVLRRKTLAVQAFESIPLLLPSLHEQRRMVDLIGALDEAITVAGEARSFARQTLVATLASSLGAQATCTVESVVSYMIGGAWGTPPGEDERDVVALGPKSYGQGRTAIDTSTATLRSLSATRAEARLTQPGDIILERSGGTPTQPVGRVIRALPDSARVVPSDFQRLLRPNRVAINPDYLFWFLWANYEAGNTLPYQKATTNIRNLNVTEYLKHTHIPVPSRAEQERVAGIADQLHAVITRHEDSTSALQTLRTNLLTALLSGEHEIPDAYDELMEA